MRLPLVRKTPLLAGAATLACLGSFAADSGLDAYEIDKWFSYNFHGLRIRPQLDVSAQFTDNVFYAPDKRGFDYLVPGQRVYLDPNPANSGYVTLAPDLTLPAYNGYISQGYVSGPVAAPVFNRTSPIFASSVYPPLPPDAGSSPSALYGYGTNSLSFQPRVADVIGTVSPGIKLQYGEDEGNLVNVEYNNDNTRYIDQGIVPDSMHRIRAQVRYENNRLRFDGSQTANYLSSFMGGGANQGQRLINRWTAVSDAKLTYDSSAKTDVYASAQYNFTDYQNKINLYSYNTWRGNLGATYKPSERFFVFTEGHYGQTALKSGSTNLIGAPYSQTYGGFVGVRGKFTSKIEGSIRGGYEVREFPNANSSYAIPAADITISYTPRDTTQLSFTYSRRTDVAAQVSRQPVAYDTARFSARQILGSKAVWMATSDISYSRGDFDSVERLGQAFDPVPGTPYRVYTVRPVNYQRTESVFNFSAGISYFPRRWLRTGLSYEYENYSNSFADIGLRGYFLPNYDAHRVMLSVQIGY